MRSPPAPVGGGVWRYANIHTKYSCQCYWLFGLEQNCQQLFENGQTESGIYTLDLQDGKSQFKVYCEMNKQEEWGLTVIQRRVSAKVPFYRDLKEYQNGFGNFKESHFLGLDKIHRLVSNEKFELYRRLESFNDNKIASAQYGYFYVGSKKDDYQLTVEKYIPTKNDAGDSMKVHNGQRFSAPDQDNDSNPDIHCAKKFRSGWWYNQCTPSEVAAHLNGVYYESGKQPGPPYDGILYETFRPETESLKSVLMAIKPKSG